MKKKPYSSVSVNQVRLEAILEGRDGQALDVGCDVGKGQVFVMLRWGEKDFEKPWRVRQPRHLWALRDRLVALKNGRQLRIGFEPTGTYGDPLRQLLTEAGLSVQRVGTKIAHDYAEVFDGVPSQHDGKDAAVVAELVALGKSRPWPCTASSPWEQEVRYWVERLAVQGRLLQQWVGRLEGLLMRHWPEVRRPQRLTSGVVLRSVAHYGGPRWLAADAAAAARLGRWSRGQWSAAQAEALVQGARHSVGVPQSVWARRLLREYARRAMAAKRRVQQARRALTRLGQGHAVLEAQASAVGLPTACVLWVLLGDPRGYDSAAAYRKAMGLNLRERSSGRYQGELKISKRGQALVRRLLYFAALRCTQRDELRSWYAARKARSGGLAATVALMRKLALAVQRLGAQGGVFEAARLLGTRRRRASGARRRRRGRRRGRGSAEGG
jgi:transposase